MRYYNFLLTKKDNELSSLSPKMRYRIKRSRERFENTFGGKPVFRRQEIYSEGDLKYVVCGIVIERI